MLAEEQSKVKEFEEKSLPSMKWNKIALQRTQDGEA